MDNDIEKVCICHRWDIVLTDEVRQLWQMETDISSTVRPLFSRFTSTSAESLCDNSPSARLKLSASLHASFIKRRKPGFFDLNFCVKVKPKWRKLGTLRVPYQSPVFECRICHRVLYLPLSQSKLSAPVLEGCICPCLSVLYLAPVLQCCICPCLRVFYLPLS